MKPIKILSLAAAIPLAATLAMAGPSDHHGETGKTGGSGMHGGRGMHGGPGGGWRRGGTMHLEKQIENLGLSAEQKKKVDALLAKAAKTNETEFTSLRTESGKLRDMLEQDKPDEKAILAQVERIGELKTESQKAMIRTLLAVRAELTPEQRAKWKEIRQENRENRKGMRQGNRQHRRDGGGKPPPPPVPTAAAE